MPRAGGDSVTLEIGGQKHRLRRGEYSPWIRLAFRAAPGVKVRGIARFLVTETEPELSLYATPIQIDPEAPALAISHPSYYAAYLAKLLGSFATVGMAEDTWALNEGAIDEAAFLEQAWLTLAEREAMFENALAHTPPRSGGVRVRHQRPRAAHVLPSSGGRRRRHRRPVPAHGPPGRQGDGAPGRRHHPVGSFRSRLLRLSARGESELLAAPQRLSGAGRRGEESGRNFEGVDWSRTRAYCLGLSGLYLNLRGRERHGMVAPGAEADALKRELIAKLAGPARTTSAGQVAIRQVYATDKLYRGPYLDAAPDLIIGYNEGYRTSWDAAVGKVTARVIEDNPKRWSGDHSVDPVLVPGVLFSSRRLDCDAPGIEDMAPTALDLFGVTPPSWMDGKPLFGVL